ncbi:hypothetical protein L6452_09816 [Arctium lappa]|uniref:Uncharacterized protein n=1 Tax=Arctium lappa TaxID=4217 RepID=A0ACB9DLF3_ARCLA|nr:hypothetical protein L6452_09816 [Arctium lappa]
MNFNENGSFSTRLLYIILRWRWGTKHWCQRAKGIEISHVASLSVWSKAIKHPIEFLKSFVPVGEKLGKL